MTETELLIAATSLLNQQAEDWSLEIAPEDREAMLLALNGADAEKRKSECICSVCRRACEVEWVSNTDDDPPEPYSDCHGAAVEMGMDSDERFS